MGLSTAVHNVLQSQQNEGNVRFCQFPEIAALCFHKQDGVEVQSLPPFQRCFLLGISSRLELVPPCGLQLLKHKRASQVLLSRFG